MLAILNSFLSSRTDLVHSLGITSAFTRAAHRVAVQRFVRLIILSLFCLIETLFVGCVQHSYDVFGRDIAHDVVNLIEDEAAISFECAH